MGVVKVIAWYAIFGIGLMVFGTLAAFNGGVWNTIMYSWLGFWIVVAVLSELAEPNEYR